MTAPRESDGPIPAESAVDYLDRARALLPRIAASADEIERERRLPASLVSGLIEAGLFRMLLPRPLAGGEIDPPTFLRVIEEIAKVDASTAWCLCQTGVCAMVAAYLPAETAWQIFGRDRRDILAWGSGPGGRAVPVEGGYRVSGTWPFASGGHHASWLGGLCVVQSAEGTPLRAQDGSPVTRTMLFPADAAAMKDIWDVIGLKGTGSDAYTVTDRFVSEAFSFARDEPSERRHNTPLYRLKTDHLFASGFASLALGVARAMLDAYIILAKEKLPRGYKQQMRESGVVQLEIGEMEARLRAARAYLMGTMAEVWQGIAGANDIALDQRMAIRLAATRTIQEARDVADAAYFAAGATAIFASNPFERRFRDMHAIAQQLQGRRSHFETVGRLILGLDADMAFL